MSPGGWQHSPGVQIACPQFEQYAGSLPDWLGGLIS